MFRTNRLNRQKTAGDNAKDQVLWSKAAKLVNKSKYGEVTYWKVVTAVYQKMGGGFISVPIQKDSKEKTFDHVNTFYSAYSIELLLCKCHAFLSKGYYKDRYCY